MNKPCIYKITSPSGKVYIGQSINVTKLRIPKYRNNDCKGQIRLYNSIKKHGWDSHKFEVIEECPAERLNERERYWQDYYDVLDKNKGLNSVLTETNTLPRVLSNEYKLKKSEKLKNRVLSDDHKRKIGEAHKGKKVSESTKSKMREYRIGKTLSDKTKKNISLKLSGKGNPMYGKKHLEKTKSIISKKRLENIKKSEPSFSKYVLNTSLGIYYSSIKDASESLNIKYHVLIDKLSGRCRNNTPFIKI